MPPRVKKTRKIAVMGFRGVGKSSLTLQFVESQFVDHYHPTIENTFSKVIKHKGEEYDIEIMDTAGQDEHSPFHSHYSLGIHGYMLVFSVISRPSLEKVRILNEKILNACGSSRVPRLLVGNKDDLVLQRKVSTEEGKAAAAEMGCAFIEASAKDNTNVVRVFTTLLDEIDKDETPPEDDSCIIL
eukprot:CAMPEP_0177681056 /NCGR_PEP_ID=MMETSP0447-20121125/30505_1 /TAXON_ID=0 /ORGANISM="Stygamoeba regulata, Strain BSH-02190019" /LENGTH=184 /DNA_ID=CAMNT_0019190433 /DNA_START=180 /DNA_END=734 /DNA_ORIENTATION=-